MKLNIAMLQLPVTADKEENLKRARAALHRAGVLFSSSSLH